VLLAWNIVYLSTGPLNPNPKPLSSRAPAASHKEFRFLLPMMGPAHIFAAFAAAHRKSLLKDMKKRLQVLEGFVRMGEGVWCFVFRGWVAGLLFQFS
jgi:hypothetical protein